MNLICCFNESMNFENMDVLIIKILAVLFVVNLLFVVLIKIDISFYILIGLDTIITSITEKYVAHYFYI